MLDLSYIQNVNNNVNIFTNAGNWSVWTKPKNARMVQIWCMGSGGGGGGGPQINSATRFGGAGGGSGNIAKGTFQASVLPDELYIYTGIGGAGGIGGVSPTTGGNGERSFVCVSPDTSSASNIVVVSGTISARGGNTGSGVISGTALGETTPTAPLAIFNNLGTIYLGAGAQSGATSAGSLAVATTTSGGAGGGSLGSGGQVTIAAGSITTPSLAAGAGGTGAANATNGRDGVMMRRPYLSFIGGSGGGGIASGGSGNAGNGGNGSYGCGGGGGGSSQTGIAGNGGRGGDGLVIIITY